MPYVTPGLREMMHQRLAHNITKGTAAVGLTGLSAGTLAGRLARGSGSRHLASSVDTDENYKALTQHLDGIPADEASLSPEDAKVLDGHNTSPGTSSNLAEVESNDLIQRARAIVNAHQEPLRQQLADRFLRAGVPTDIAAPLADTYLSLPGHN